MKIADHPLGQGNDRARFDLDPRFFQHLAPAALNERFAGLLFSSRNRPQSEGRLFPPADQENPLERIENDRAYADSRLRRFIHSHKGVEPSGRSEERKSRSQAAAARRAEAGRIA